MKVTLQRETAETGGGRKRRVIGSVVLFVLALIILPQLFDGEGSYQPQVDSRIPEKPIITLLPEPRQTRPVMLSDDRATNNSATIVEQQVVEQADSADLDAPARVIDLTELVDSAGNTDIQQSPIAVSEEPSQPKLDADGLPEGWVVQVGSFADLGNASALVERLLSDGFKAYEQRSLRGSQELATVFVGPVLDRVEAQRLRDQLHSEQGHDGLVKKYQLEALF